MSDETGGGASRSTDPAAGTSSATDISLREYLTSLIKATEQQAEARFVSMQRSVDAAFSASQLAIDKANEATDKRFEGVNEFRAQLADQAAHFITRQTMEALVDKLETEIERNRQDLDNLSRRIDVREGEHAGSKVTMGNLVVAATLIIGVIGVIVVLANWGSG